MALQEFEGDDAVLGKKESIPKKGCFILTF